MFQECPAGSVNEATFKEIYEKFFPYGSKYWSGVVNVMKLNVLSSFLLLFLVHGFYGVDQLAHV